MFWSIRRRKPSPTERLFGSLGALGHRPRHLVDIGETMATGRARRWPQFLRPGSAWSSAPRKLAQLHRDLAANPRVAIRYKGVGDVDATRPFTLHPRDDSSSFVYGTEAAAKAGMVQEEIAICRLDTVLAGSAFGPPDIVKIDAEGTADDCRGRGGAGRGCGRQPALPQHRRRGLSHDG